MACWVPSQVAQVCVCVRSVVSLVGLFLLWAVPCGLCVENVFPSWQLPLNLKFKGGLFRMCVSKANLTSTTQTVCGSGVCMCVCVSPSVVRRTSPRGCLHDRCVLVGMWVV